MATLFETTAGDEYLHYTLNSWIIVSDFNKQQRRKVADYCKLLRTNEEERFLFGADLEVYRLQIFNEVNELLDDNNAFSDKYSGPTNKRARNTLMSPEFPYPSFREYNALYPSREIKGQ